jgi:hypothetical protein
MPFVDTTSLRVIERLPWLQPTVRLSPEDAARKLARASSARCKSGAKAPRELKLATAR